ncbi:MAG: hypothetical protein REI96_00460 [Flavobacterium nitrogenifigens]|uniref:hypothetical protein n=1 Tax=Flavobacterium nitrogenifigens TaxID=1617283 RepID=UPI002808FE79|nr:hypothetical protein [Flavobacterium nitrogenifigens]MDQ8010888.1 hypothetical protein [Flavobacterium nitrogenifigens]
MGTNNLSETNEALLWETKIDVNNKKQYILMMEALASTLFTGTKGIFAAILLFIVFILTWKLAYHTTWGQITLIISFIAFSITAVMSVNFALGRLSFIKSIPKTAERLQYPVSFIYQFYKSGIYTKNQDLEGFFNYNSFHSIGVSEKGIQFLFQFKNSTIGSQLHKKYKVSSFWMPTSTLEEKEQQQLIAFMTELKKDVKNINFRKS